MTESYVTIAEADDYFSTRLHSDSWADESPTDRRNALLDASRRIDRLNIAGDKTDPSQVNEFPRNDDTTIPDDIKIACYEIAFSLLDGIDPEMELEKLATSSQGYSSARTSYDRTLALEHFGVGIPSSIAWRYLRPYLRNTKRIKVLRVD